MLFQYINCVRDEGGFLEGLGFCISFCNSGNLTISNLPFTEDKLADLLERALLSKTKARLPLIMVRLPLLRLALVLQIGLQMTFLLRSVGHTVFLNG